MVWSKRFSFYGYPHLLAHQRLCFHWEAAEKSHLGWDTHVFPPAPKDKILFDQKPEARKKKNIYICMGCVCAGKCADLWKGNTSCSPENLHKRTEMMVSIALPCVHLVFEGQHLLKHKAMQEVKSQEQSWWKVAESKVFKTLVTSDCTGLTTRNPPNVRK